MKSESPISEKFFYSPQFCELISEAKKFQLENAKNKLNDLSNPENPLMKEVFKDKNFEKVKWKKQSTDTELKSAN